jgi:hypothetical protein
MAEQTCPTCAGEGCPYCGGPDRDYHTMCFDCHTCKGTGKVEVEDHELTRYTDYPEHLRQALVLAEMLGGMSATEREYRPVDHG